MSAIVNALSSGFTTQQILSFLKKKFPQYKDSIENALAMGYGADKIIQQLTKDKSGKLTVPDSTFTESEKQTQIEEQRSAMHKKRALQTGASIAALAGGAYMLPQAMTAMQGMMGNKPTPSPMNQTPGQAINNQVMNPGQTPSSVQGQSQGVVPSPQIQQLGKAPVNYTEIIQKSPGISKKIDDLISSGNDVQGISGYFRKFAQKDVDAIEKQSGEAFESVIQNYLQDKGKQNAKNTQMPAQEQ